MHADDKSQTPATAAIAESGLSHEVRTHGPASSLQESATLRGISPGQIIKSMVVRLPGHQYAIVLVPGGRKISWKKFRTALGVNRAVMPSAEEAYEVTGFPRGTITPFGTKTPLPVYADNHIPHGEISMGGGTHGVALMLTGDDLLRHFHATRLDITDEE
ncbi:MAG: aminoacyl-tRNA deacylase [Canibacter sp.]